MLLGVDDVIAKKYPDGRNDRAEAEHEADKQPDARTALPHEAGRVTLAAYLTIRHRVYPSNEDGESDGEMCVCN